MVNSVTDYARLVVIHKTLGVTIFAVMLVRIVNRLTHRPRRRCRARSARWNASLPWLPN
ncbi:cytochrome b561 family protein [Mycobacterium xenopi 4042]|uniref:Cytochrome b561 family protein n=1 Tax=Mycobacterium xenopi 4042 TaxID=1299334 RepID=X8DC83_MYCXE|nr:cytochrome b561 family protein [Mycobacterium xenopi 4042]